MIGEPDEQFRIAATGNDAEWFALTGNCGHCGCPPDACECTEDDPCGCRHLHPAAQRDRP